MGALSPSYIYIYILNESNIYIYISLSHIAINMPIWYVL